MTLAEKQARMIEDLSIIDDPQERLALVVDRARSRRRSRRANAPRPIV
ncbi:MAG: hypothetical protein WDM96_02575 [Lacunisphaera sp.]